MGLIYKKVGRKILILLLVLQLFPINQVYCGWTSSVEVITGAWGNNVGQFGIEYSDTADIYPVEFGVDKDGNILVADLVNKRVQIFKADGNAYGIINKPTEINVRMWPRSLVVLSEGNSFLGNLYIFNYTGDVIYKVNIAKSERYGFYNGYVIKNLDNNLYYLYSPSGTLIKTSTERPLELGVVRSSIRQTDGSRMTVIEYNDTIYHIKVLKMLENFTRDTSGNLYGIIKIGPPGNMFYSVHKYNKCGKDIGSVDLPANNIIVEPNTIPPRPTPEVTIIAEYGSPVIAPNGDVYTWKRTPDKYSILKWQWQDDPNIPTGPDAPTGLTVVPSTTGIYLTWTASPQDPGCVTGYEIARATTAGGVFSTVSTVDKGVLKYNDTTAQTGTTYYYKVRAIAGNEYSPYTSEMSGKR